MTTKQTPLWHPTATSDILEAGASLRHCIRDWMRLNDILEVVTPVLSRHAAIDPQVHSVVASDGSAAAWYLHTSPEFPMKRLLSAYRRDIYQIAQVFRRDESGRYHNIEFSLLEWYRTGFDHHDLLQDVSALLKTIWQVFGRVWQEPVTLSYGEVVRKHLAAWPESLVASDIKQHFEQHGRSYPEAIGDDLDAALDLFFDEFVLPTFDLERITFLTDYPASQAALAKVGTDTNNRLVAERFEVYAGEVELANAFHELLDADTQAARFSSENQVRQRTGPAVPVDEHLIAALEAGMPQCAGIALGLDRLLMVLTDSDAIKNVMAFPAERA